MDGFMRQLSEERDSSKVVGVTTKSRRKVFSLANELTRQKWSG